MRILAAMAVSAVMLLGACADEPPPPDTTGGIGSQTAGGPAAGSVGEFQQVVGDRVFFDTDRHDLDSLAQSTLQRQAQWLQTYSGYTVTIEGHADERGTRQYNLALGARRANSVRQYLIAQGIPANRLRAVTYGKERPVALCSDESCWSQNRRGVSVVAGTPTS